MVKSINVYFDDNEFQGMMNFKNNLSWHDFILLMFTHCLEAQKKGDFEIIKKNG